MGRKVLLIGLGMQGKAVLHDLVESAAASQIIVVDNQPDLQSQLSCYRTEKVSGRVLDAADVVSLAAVMRDVDVVVEALPGDFALPIGRLATDCGVSLVSSMYYLNPGEQDQEKVQSAREQIRGINQQAKEKGITILTEFGLDPGLDLILSAKAVSEMDNVEEFYAYGTGLPSVSARANPLQYKFSWSIMGVMRVYQRPARIISQGRVVEIASMELFAAGNWHILEVEEIGAALECFPNGDSVPYAELLGIRDSVKEMGRFTGRWPGHCAFWDKIVKCGFLGEQPIRVGNELVSPIRFTASLLASQQQFHYADDEADLTFIRVDVRGTRRGKGVQLIYQIIDTRDLQTGLTSMQRTVGFTMSQGARLILDGRLKSGLLTPLDVPAELVFPALEKHNLRVMRRENTWG